MRPMLALIPALALLAACGSSGGATSPVPTVTLHPSLAESNAHVSPNPPAANTDFNLSVTITNSGPVASSPTIVRLLQVFANGTTSQVSVESVSALNYLQSQTIVVPIAGLPAGPYGFQFTVDPYNTTGGSSAPSNQAGIVFSIPPSGNG